MKTLLLVSAFGALVAAPAAAQPGRLTGMWDYQDRATDSAGMTTPPATAAIQALRAKKRAAADGGYVRDIANILCLPTGFPSMMHWKSPIEILESPGRVTVISEHDPGNDEPRTVYLDKTMPADAAPSWNGYSTGHWDGDVLVVQTSGFNDRAGLFSGVPRTPATRITERFIVKDGGATLLDEMTITDPAVLTGPWLVTLRYARMPQDTERLEAVCEPDLEALKGVDLAAIKDMDLEAARLLDPDSQYNPGSR